ncbi:MAG: hypothetical protein ACE5PT_13350 [Gemmatimonadales bacterium]
MEGIFPFLVPIALFFTIGTVSTLPGPPGKALGDPLAGGGALGRGEGQETEAMRVELDDLRYRVSDMEERIDFTERMLTKERHSRLPPAD